jgi:hypothetical protein
MTLGRHQNYLGPPWFFIAWGAYFGQHIGPVIV